MKTIKIHVYQRGTDRLEFLPWRGLPGFTHRVILNGVATQRWLGLGRPSVQAAEYFFGLLVDGAVCGTCGRFHAMPDCGGARAA